MKFTLEWLGQHFDSEASLETLCAKMTLQGLEVEEVKNNAALLKDFIIAEVTECQPPPECR